MGCLYSVPNDKVYVVERCGKFDRAAHAGLLMILPCLQRVRGELTKRVTQLDVVVETKTKDNVFVQINVSIQYVVKMDKLFEAMYRLMDKDEQMKAYVFDIVRSEVPKLNLDETFESKDDIANAVKQYLKNVMDGFGYSIVKTLVTDISPDENVRAAMNRINASKQKRDSTIQNAEAEKLRIVKKAEAEAESKILKGEGLAKQRAVIMDGLIDAINDFMKKHPSMSVKEVVDLIFVHQYFEMIKEVGKSGKSSSFYLPHSPSSLCHLASEIKAGIVGR